METKTLSNGCSERENRLKASLESYKRVSTAHLYQFEIDTEDIVLGFKNTLKKRTRNLVKAVNIRAKLLSDLGTFISPSVKIMAIRFYTDGELKHSQTVVLD